MRIFLGGTCNNSQWREEQVIPILEKLGIEYFNPVVPNWNSEAQQRELEERENCDYCLYVITPAMTGVYSIAEVVDDSNKRPEKTIFMFLDQDLNTNFTGHQTKSLNQVGKMIESNGGAFILSLEDLETAFIQYQNIQ